MKYEYGDALKDQETLTPVKSKDINGTKNCAPLPSNISGLYYKHITIVIDAASVVSK